MENTNTCTANNGHIHSTTQLEFQQAMQDFKSMFPGMDHDVIEEVLRANQGAVDATIDQLLSMTTDNLNEALRFDLERLEERSLKSKSKIKASSESSVIRKNNGMNSDCTKNLKKWSPPLLGPLPPTFLRIESQKSIADYGEDERIALFLQNEEFLSELRINQDFMNTLDEDVGEKGSSGHDLEAFKERLRNMGKISKNKFAQLSRVFQRRKKSRSAKGIFDQNVSSDSMLLSGEPLLSEGLDEPFHKE